MSVTDLRLTETAGRSELGLQGSGGTYTGRGGFRIEVSTYAPLSPVPTVKKGQKTTCGQGGVGTIFEKGTYIIWELEFRWIQGIQDLK